jgi:septation ring formation regulator EzrA
MSAVMEANKELKEEIEEIRRTYVTHRHLDAVIPALQRTLDEVRADIKQLLVVVHNSNGKKQKPEPN